MSVTWTKEQQKVISLKDRNILVAAAAGSGKTAVLVERIITMITRPENPVSIDRLLIVTFTEAAASEMKDRIRAAIETKIEEDPENELLRNQATLIYSAQITTIHSFCLSVIREHFHTIDLDPGFRIAEEGELKLLCQEVLEEVIEKRYQEDEQRFLDFVDSYGGVKNDKKIEDIILRLYNFSRSYPIPDKWFEDCIRAYQIDSEEELNETMFFKNVVSQVEKNLMGAKECIEEGLKICNEPDGPYMYGEMLEADLACIESLEMAEGYRGYYEAFASLPKWKVLSRRKDDTVSVEKREQVKKLRESVKETVKNLAVYYFEQPVEEVLNDLRVCLPAMQEMVELTKRFALAFEEEKRSKNIIDFDDMQQYAMRILTEYRDGELVPTAVAREYQEHFAEIMIDEYQDSNLIQETILTSVSRVPLGEPNIFMVGDVKQSIYRFRLSRPELFMDKYNTYSDGDSLKQKIDLHKNFRSREEVLESVNFLFHQIMKRELGGIEYDDQAALHVGASFVKSSGNETEIILVPAESDEDMTSRDQEAIAIGIRIRKLMEQHQVIDKKTGRLRPVSYKDIVILTRSLKGVAEACGEQLTKMGIPVHAVSKGGYFDTQEIGVFLDYLKILHNRRQDIPLAAVLRSYFGKITEEEMAKMKGAYPLETPFWKTVSLYELEGSDENLVKKLQECLQEMEEYRKKMTYLSLHELLETILDESGYRDYISALPRGEQRLANINMLVEKARSFEKTSYKGLFHFNRYIDQLRKYQISDEEANIMDEQSDAVRIMSIHKSKGLEFPIVFVAGMSKRFNFQDTNGDVLMHESLGVGLESVNLADRTKAPSYMKSIIARQEHLETLGEELRILYVALTRAKEKLIVTGALKNPDHFIAEVLQARENCLERKKIPYTILSGAVCYLDWIKEALKTGSGSGKIQLYPADMQEQVVQDVLREKEDAFTRSALENWNTEKCYDPDMKQRLEEQFGYQYPHHCVQGIKLKYTVSELKKRAFLAEESGEIVFEEEPIVPLIPKFLQQEEKEIKGAGRGTVYHRVMEMLDFSSFDENTKPENLECWMANLVRLGKISEEMKHVVKLDDVVLLLKSTVGKRMRRAAQNKTLWKEQPFVLGIPMDELHSVQEGDQEMVLVQGIIDVYFEEEGEVVVLDYKTDQIWKEAQLVEKYKAQLEYYARALEQITGKRVKEKIIYSFTLGKEIPV